MPAVSVIMPSFNYGCYLAAAIDSVLNQSYGDLELIITDDCSTDESRDIIEQYRRVDERVIVILHDANRGLAQARNSALAIGSGQFVALCDADDIWLPEKLERQVERFNCLEVGLVHTDSMIMDSDGNMTGQRFSQLAHRRRQPTSGYLFDELCRRNFICVPTVMLRREAIDRAGRFHDTLRSLEDWVCWVKIAKHYEVAYIGDTLARYRVHRTSLSQNTRGMAQNRVMALHLLLDYYSDLPRASMSQMLYSLGSSYMELGDAKAAAKAFLGSVGANPIQLRGWLRYWQLVGKISVEHRI